MVKATVVGRTRPQHAQRELGRFSFGPAHAGEERLIFVLALLTFIACDAATSAGRFRDEANFPWTGVLVVTAHPTQPTPGPTFVRLRSSSNETLLVN